MLLSYYIVIGLQNSLSAGQVGIGSSDGGMQGLSVISANSNGAFPAVMMFPSRLTPFGSSSGSAMFMNNMPAQQETIPGNSNVISGPSPGRNLNAETGFGA